MKPIDKWKTKRHQRLTKRVAERNPKTTFNSSAIKAQQAGRLQTLNQNSPLHTTWKSLDVSRRSAACRFEWARLQLFLLGIVLPLLLRTALTFYHITVADKRWHVVPTSASRKSLDPPRRKVRAAIQTLRADGYKPVFVAAYEVSGDRKLDGNYTFEPHVHLIIGGAPIEKLKVAFQVRLAREARGRDKPLRIEAIPEWELGNLLGYLAKMKAQDRVQYIESNGRRNRTPNRMSTAEANLWLRCMASIPITHAVQFGGFEIPLTSRFIKAQMATIIGTLK
ncbi:MULTISPECIES: hypothetical protein [unclassified Rhizobium]|uniref:hypothetical protein n=1 Tax=unclassified Rhizobium TaxID=2613769 RepID=UPI00177FED5F|nr:MULTISPECIES: hypothetical protein [unclassified Rhizobium]MBD8685996.1 hypothetical protein [Rhizobium sp. CFBP 13644]MBD8690331.1 hypothetical protein [Rhizobium sp. CFBP 13717]